MRSIIGTLLHGYLSVLRSDDINCRPTSFTSSGHIQSPRRSLPDRPRLVCHVPMILIALGLFASELQASADAEAKLAAPQARVVGGDVATPDSWPATVALVRADGGNSPGQLFSRQFCAGTVIAPRWVLTAAHCVAKYGPPSVSPDSLRVVVGIDDLSTDTAVDERVVTNIIVNENWGYITEGAWGSPSDSEGDIALLELANEVSVAPASLADTDAEELAGSGTSATVVGWGMVDTRNLERPKYDPRLREGTVPLVSRQKCNKELAYYFDGAVYADQLCAGFASGEVDACYGDSGGPLYRKAAGKQQLIGVVSGGFADECEVPYAYSQYSDVEFYRSWITQFVSLDQPSPPPYETAPPTGQTASERERGIDDIMTTTSSGGDRYAGSEGVGGTDMLLALLLTLGVTSRVLRVR